MNQSFLIDFPNNEDIQNSVQAFSFSILISVTPNIKVMLELKEENVLWFSIDIIVKYYSLIVLLRI